ncbi:MAG TPA: ABC transporter ATP-binding protein [Spirochaetota bacterium]|jgi:branched-chain amino acid transport system ATP-binding protein|nr:ABC transporter ATP-binding protein [Spirochaetota bacterium]HOK93501.1 ABC transporter ATP-binding protein [Spirochaetota bacterium]HON15761.1 ABC transporter ATP-binding protein [Spirochaetota bacterium]HPD77247.1 ABC transporter ATP-binding protein [Spirochaetota bacterium]HPP96083.1 ABC transporter ATP-binding protein [Spirochaetota bacterium]
MLKIEGLTVNYGGIKALKGIDMDVPEGKIITLVGANGAGKSTTLRSVVGLTKITSGKIYYQGQNITGKNTVDIVRSGIVLVPEGRRIFPNLTVYENLVLGGYCEKNKKIFDERLEHVCTVFPRLKERLKQKAGTFSGGEQQMLALGRALMANPKLLMLDEPSLGLAPLIVKNIFEIIQTINKSGVTVLLIEQNAKAALEIADYGYVLETGNIVLKGSGVELLNNENVRKAYLGIA